MAVTIDDIRRAADTIRGHVERTPCVRSRTLSEITGAEVWLKFENLQFTASFKERGACNKLTRLLAAGTVDGVIAMSAGNHAQAVACHARRLGVAATIVMPRTTPNVKVERTRIFGAEVVLHGDSLEEAREEMQWLARSRALAVVHPYDDEDVIAGQGTVALEMLEQAPALDALLVPVGGGGLIAGIAVAVAALRPDVEVYGVEADRFPSMHQALAGLPVVCGTSTIAEGIAVKQPGAHTLPLVRELVREILLVDELTLEESVLALLEIEKTVVEGAAAAGLAALRRHGERFAGRRVGLVLSGGNIDLMPLSSILQRGLVRSGRLVRLVVEIPDVPGALGDMTTVFGRTGANIVEIRHQRAFTNLSLRATEVEIVANTLGREHLDEVVAALEAAGYVVRVL
jgi:threonine dehydratase